MSNETKRDVFDDALAYAPVGREYDPVNDDEAGDLRSCLSARYAAALPDDLPVIPKEVGDAIIKLKHKRFSLSLAMSYAAVVSLSSWMTLENEEDFAIAWLQGAWRVEGTGEIVKLEVDE